MLYWILWVLLAPPICLFLPTKVLGKRYLKNVKKQATILSCNHQSLNDPIVIKAKIKPTSRMMAKNSLFKKKFPRWFMTKLGAYPVNREGNDISAVKTTLKHLKENKTVTIFPEGTRGASGDLNNLKHGLVMFALKTDCYVVPMYFKKKPKVFNFNTILIGKPFKFSDYDEFKGVKPSHEVLDRACDVLSEKMQFLKGISTKEYKKLLKEEQKLEKVQNKKVN